MSYAMCRFSMIMVHHSLIKFVLSFQWHMECGSGLAASQSTQSIFMSGVMLGSFLVGGIGDKYGRFPAVIGCQLLCGVFGFISSFASSWVPYVVLRYVVCT